MTSLNKHETIVQIEEKLSKKKIEYKKAMRRGDEFDQLKKIFLEIKDLEKRAAMGRNNKKK